MQAECRRLGDSDTPEVSPLLKTAARSLKERPVLFKYCAEEVGRGLGAGVGMAGWYGMGDGTLSGVLGGAGGLGTGGKY